MEAGLLLIPLLVSYLYHENTQFAFLIPIGLLLLLFVLCGVRAPKDSTFFAKEGFVVVALAWILMSLIGALPFFLSGQIPNYLDAVFETISGFTTTGSSILQDVESLTHSMHFWRSFTHWIGGMGVLVFMMAILPMSSNRSMHLMRAEVAGPSVGKISSKMKDTARMLYIIYLGMTLLETILLLAGGMSLFDSLINAFGTAGTGGFSNYSLSIGAYNNVYFEMVIAVFMVLFGVNFNLYYLILLKRAKEAFQSEELRVYLCIVVAATIMIGLNIFDLYKNFLTALRYSFFQVATIITTTGYATADFNMWPPFSKVILVFLMFFGGCAGSTAGGLKIARIILLLKSVKQEIRHMVHPHSVNRVRFEGKPLDEKIVKGTTLYFNTFLILFVSSVLLLTLEKKDIISTFTAVVACINNIGPGLNIVGPTGNFSSFSVFGKIILSIDMLFGRLEIFPLLILMIPGFWFRHNKDY